MVSSELAPEQQDRGTRRPVRPRSGRAGNRRPTTTRRVPLRHRAKLGKRGMLVLPFPEEYGGAWGADYFRPMLALEELAGVDPRRDHLEAGSRSARLPITGRHAEQRTGGGPSGATGDAGRVRPDDRLAGSDSQAACAHRPLEGVAQGKKGIGWWTAARPYHQTRARPSPRW